MRNNLRPYRKASSKGFRGPFKCFYVWQTLPCIYGTCFVFMFYQSFVRLHENDPLDARPSSDSRHQDEHFVPIPRKEKGEDDQSSMIDFLLQLARLPTSELRRCLNDEDIFQLKLLESSKQCPTQMSLSHSPPPIWFPSDQYSKRKKSFVLNSTNHPLLWYEHLSKAGGTSFCKLAQINMKPQQVPPYYCMPRDGALPDGRVGLWSNGKLKLYLQQNPRIRIVSNEWQPFPPERWTMRDDLYLATTLRDPLDRLLSAYHFWGILHNPDTNNKPTFSEWLERKRKRSAMKSPRDIDHAIHIGRYNFMVWKFSNGTMPQGKKKNPSDGSSSIAPEGISRQEENVWIPPFTTAIRTLSRFDLVLILELMSSHSSRILKKSLGWTKLEKNHVVPSGKVENNHATESLPKDLYDQLWEANRFDMILYYWMKAVHLLHVLCSED
jgi:hypothetical protein